MKRMSLVAMALLSLMMMMTVTAPGALAEEVGSAWPDWTCTTFPGTVAEAAAYFVENGGPASLDLDGDGVACELGEDYAVGLGGASAWPDWTCTTFPGSITDAITQYETYGAPTSLDGDGDGTACEAGEDYEMAAEDSDPSAWPDWTCTTFPGTVAEAHAYFAENGGPATLESGWRRGWL